MDIFVGGEFEPEIAQPIGAAGVLGLLALQRPIFSSVAQVEVDWRDFIQAAREGDVEVAEITRQDMIDGLTRLLHTMRTGDATHLIPDGD